MSSYRSYHGGTNTTLAMTGDSRRWAGESGDGYLCMDVFLAIVYVHSDVTWAAKRLKSQKSKVEVH